MNQKIQSGFTVTVELIKVFFVNCTNILTALVTDSPKGSCMWNAQPTQLTMDIHRFIKDVWIGRLDERSQRATSLSEAICWDNIADLISNRDFMVCDAELPELKEELVLNPWSVCARAKLLGYVSRRDPDTDTIVELYRWFLENYPERTSVIRESLLQVLSHSNSPFNRLIESIRSLDEATCTLKKVSFPSAEFPNVQGRDSQETEMYELCDSYSVFQKD